MLANRGKAVVSVKCMASMIAAATLLSGCGKIDAGTDIYAGHWFCFSHKGIGHAKGTQTADWFVHEIEVNGVTLSVYEGSGFNEIDNAAPYTSKNGWKWQYGEVDGVVVLERNTTDGEGWPPQIDVQYKAADQLKLSVKELAESFHEMPKGGKCQAIYIR